MKTTTALKLLAITLILIFIVGPTTASAATGKAAILEGYKSSSSISSSNNIKPDWAKLDLPVATFETYEKDLWQSLPATGPYCSSCAIKNATRAYNSLMKEDYFAYSPLSGFFFGGGGFDGGGGGACC
ncbi:MAG: hypothetical protein LUO81_02890 [Methanoregulaceae archaeon]|nr:hypothetical protein [Methanoregulaceae archaeon]